MKGIGAIIDIASNNISSGAGYQTVWGNACLVRGFEKTVLFDTGGDGRILMDNLRKLDVEPSQIGIVVFSHEHSDHTHGVWEFLKARSGIRAFVLDSFSKPFIYRLLAAGVEVVEVEGPLEICGGVHTTGAMEGIVKEQSMVLKTQRGLAVLTGCAHPGIAEIVERSMKLLGDKPYLVLGGFHLKDASPGGIQAVIERLRALGVEKIAPNHCTGKRAIEMFKAAWGQDFLETGCGAVVEV